MYQQAYGTMALKSDLNSAKVLQCRQNPSIIIIKASSFSPVVAPDQLNTQMLFLNLKV